MWSETTDETIAGVTAVCVRAWTSAQSPRPKALYQRLAPLAHVGGDVRAAWHLLEVLERPLARWVGDVGTAVPGAAVDGAV